jgi:chromosome segregation ATPase
MESSTPPIVPTIVITQPDGIQKTINKTLPLHMQKSNFEQRFNSFKEELLLCQNQFDLCKTELLSCDNKMRKCHKKINILTKGLTGFIEDQGRINQNTKKQIMSFDSEQLQLNELIKVIAETATSLEERVKTTEQNILELSQTTPYQKNAIDKLSTEQTTLSELIKTLTELETKSQERIEKSEDNVSSLQTIIRLHQETIQQQNQLIAKTTKWLYASTASSVILFIGLWYYSRK